ncbi:MAG: LLM class flavin-dependent oxidoreductase, partial [Candidatus Bathyarchaeia archaeon]
HPVLTAIAVACVDEIASGRVVLGMGAGMSGFKELGIKRKSPAVAIKEAVEIMRGVLTGKPLFYEGAVFKVSGARLSFKARGDIPIYVAGRGPRVLETAGKVGDGAILGGFASEESVNYAFDQIRRGADAAGRNWEDLDYVSWVYCSLSEDGKEAKRVVKPIVAYLMEASEPVLERLGIQREIADPVIKGLKELRKEGAFSLYSREMMELASNLVSDKLVDKYSIAGTPEECARKVRRLLRLGIKQIAILPFPLPGGKNEDVMRLFAEEVIPQFK